MIEWLTGTLVATSVLMLLVLAVREPVRRHFGAPVTYALWLLPALRMVLPSFTTIVERVQAPAQPAITLAPMPSSAVAEPSLLEQIGGWPALLVAIWLSGAAAMLVRGFLVYRAQRAAILACGVQIAGLGNIRIVRSECVAGPLAFGIFDRVIALPIDFDDRFSERERCFALNHELAHHRSGDLVANTIAFVLLCLQWFNPLAWAAHAAFRFDQEAACDARVLDKADAGDRAFYGSTIAKAASGRTLLLVGALDRPSTLSRRLTIMTNSTNTRARKLGFLILGGGLLLALPMTATSAVRYIDVAAPTPVLAARSPAPVRPVSTVTQPIPVSPAVKLASLAQVSTVSPGPADISFIGNDSVTINGVTKKWEELTPAERARIRADTDKARKQLRKEMATMPERMADARREMEKFRNGDFAREMAQSKEGMRQALAAIDSEAGLLRATGQDPEKMRGDLLKSIREIEAMDIAKISREAIAAVDSAQIETSLREAQRSLDDIETKLNRLDGR